MTETSKMSVRRASQFFLLLVLHVVLKCFVVGSIQPDIYWLYKLSCMSAFLAPNIESFLPLFVRVFTKPLFV